MATKKSAKRPTDRVRIAYYLDGVYFVSRVSDDLLRLMTFREGQMLSHKMPASDFEQMIRLGAARYFSPIEEQAVIDALRDVWTSALAQRSSH